MSDDKIIDINKIRKKVDAPHIPEETVQQAIKDKVEFQNPTNPNIAMQPQSISRIVPKMNEEMKDGAKFVPSAFIDQLQADYKVYKNNNTLGPECKGKCFSTFMCKWECYLMACINTLKWRRDGNGMGTVNYDLHEKLISDDEAKMVRENINMFIAKIKEYLDSPRITV